MKELKFDKDSFTALCLSKAIYNFKKNSQKHDLKSLAFFGIGSKQIKKFKVFPYFTLSMFEISFLYLIYRCLQTHLHKWQFS